MSFFLMRLGGVDIYNIWYKELLTNLPTQSDRRTAMRGGHHLDKKSLLSASYGQSIVHNEGMVRQKWGSRTQMELKM
jgi:hypothetical protein